MARRAAVVGGGIIGISCAYYLQREGWEVVLVDAKQPGQGCSHANCGYISLSHVMPLHGPGVIAKTLHAMLRPGSPFSIRPRLDIKLWGWLLQFARRCNTRDARRSAQGLASLLGSTGPLYDQLFEDEPIACELQRDGCLFVFQDADHMRAYEATDAMLRSEFGVGAEKFDRDELLAFEPALKEGVAGGWFYPQDRHLRPDRLVSQWLDVVRDRGAEVLEHHAMTGLEGDRRTTGVRTSRGVVEADVVVVAAGALTSKLGDVLGCRLPIQPGKGYSITTSRPERCPQRPLIFQDHKVAVTPMQSAYRIGSTMEFAGYDTELRSDRIQILRDAARLYLHQPEGDEVLEQWYGWRSMTHDGLPRIGPAPAWENVWIATGHNMLGLTMAPVTGKLIAEMVQGRPPHLDPAPFRP